MPLKTLPSLGDSNWGTPLNNYIAQTTDNTKGGAFNSFTNFADRPTNLTADDRGKTYLNNKTNNFHEWDGTKWIVRHTSSFLNVKDFGNVGTADDTLVVQSAINYIQQGNSTTQNLYLPGGQIYTFEVELRGNISVNFIGDGYSYNGSDPKTEVRPKSVGKYVFTFHCSTYQSITNMNIIGSVQGGGRGNGIKCVPVPSADPNENLANIGQFAVNLENVFFGNCDICLYKQACFFGSFKNCQFAGSNIGVFAKGGGVLYQSLYSGFDYYDHCRWYEIAQCCVFYSNPNNYDENQTKFENCWFEKNYGITCLAIGTGIALNSLKFSHCWFELCAINYNQSINIDGTDYTIKEFIFDNSRGAIEYGYLPKGIILKNKSYLKLDNVNGNSEVGQGFEQVFVDAGSYLDCKNIGGDSYNGMSTDFTADSSLLYYQSENRRLATYRTSSNKPLVTRNYENLVPFGSCASILPVDGAPFSTNNAIAKIISGDGLYNNRCLQVTMSQEQNYAIGYGTWGRDYGAKPYFVYSFAIKCALASQSNPVSIRSQWSNLVSDVNLRDGNWHTYTGSLSLITTYINFYPLTGTGSTTFLLSKIQIVQFATYQEAVDYLKSDFYALPAGDPISWHDSAIPTTGTYAKGDVIYNTNPTPGGYMGWTCTTAGSPGIWKGFGLIQL
jgi:hypothetical protein